MTVTDRLRLMLSYLPLLSAAAVCTSSNAGTGLAGALDWIATCAVIAPFTLAEAVSMSLHGDNPLLVLWNQFAQLYGPVSSSEHVPLAAISGLFAMIVRCVYQLSNVDAASTKHVSRLHQIRSELQTSHASDVLLLQAHFTCCAVALGTSLTEACRMLPPELDIPLQRWELIVLEPVPASRSSAVASPTSSPVTAAAAVGSRSRSRATEYWQYAHTALNEHAGDDRLCWHFARQLLRLGDPSSALRLLEPYRDQVNVNEQMVPSVYRTLCHCLHTALATRSFQRTVNAFEAALALFPLHTAGGAQSVMSARRLIWQEYLGCLSGAHLSSSSAHRAASPVVAPQSSSSSPAAAAAGAASTRMIKPFSVAWSTLLRAIHERRYLVHASHTHWVHQQHSHHAPGALNLDIAGGAGGSDADVRPHTALHSLPVESSPNVHAVSAEPSRSKWQRFMLGSDDPLERMHRNLMVNQWLASAVMSVTGMCDTAAQRSEILATCVRLVPRALTVVLRCVLNLSYNHLTPVHFLGATFHLCRWSQHELERGNLFAAKQALLLVATSYPLIAPTWLG